MDDFIYFLLLIAWLAFSFYQQSVKKKKRQEQMRAAREREQNQPQELTSEDQVRDREPLPKQVQPQEEGQDFRKTLEEILMGEGFREKEYSRPFREEAETAATWQESVENESERKKNVFQKYYDEEMLEGSQETENLEQEKLENKIEELEQEMTLEENEKPMVTEESKSCFDLRKAVIYSEILNRRYN